ncbi:hypothetical protein FB565_007000 [Actinoplanes lutulentus]|uniref:Uncharacterized protein n=1 Tax=Actinoplanes lutulentus TaxID=1287878 RepID=A0A327ZA18_9ACTN|nr:hypothetical protein [Actinoplanes lutulentus]MBB2947232.1 hypothetical protein [Actinoplanes lutulentus]RAK36507.1 hypothetical protein B0I29_10896 [Actinoplanes lutulentus]
MNDLHVDPAVLDGIAERLRHRGDAIDAAGDGAPGTPDAGQDTAAIAAILAALCANSAQLVTVLHETGSRVAAASRAYVSEDASAAGHIAGGY